MPEEPGRQRHVLVTGASSGIGRAVVDRLLEEGHSVLGLARDFGRFPCSHARFRHLEVDLSRLEPLPEFFKKLVLAHPRLDAVIFSAGRGLFGTLEQFSSDDICQAMNLNFTSHALLARTLVPRLREAGRGDLIFIGSEAGLRGRRKGSIYCAGKFALRGFAQALREECAPSGVRVTIINPGMVKTPFFDHLDFAPGDNPENFILPEDVARTVSLVLEAREGTVFDEINLSPLKHVVKFRPERTPEKPREDTAQR